MSLTVSLKIRPFTVPNYVLLELPPVGRQEGFAGNHSLPLSELDADTLDQLCYEFRKAVFQKARKTDPSIKIGGRPHGSS